MPVLQVTDVACKFFKPAGNCILSDKILATVVLLASYDPEDPLGLKEPYTGPCSFDQAYAEETSVPLCRGENPFQSPEAFLQ